jgi:serine protease inhibitor
LAEVKQVDFSKNAEAAKTINGWVETTTQGKIKDLISAGESVVKIEFLD